MALVMSHLACAEDPPHPLNRAADRSLRPASPAFRAFPPRLPIPRVFSCRRRSASKWRAPAMRSMGAIPRPAAPIQWRLSCVSRGGSSRFGPIERGETVGYGAHMAAPPAAPRRLSASAMPMDSCARARSGAMAGGRRRNRRPPDVRWSAGSRWTSPPSTSPVCRKVRPSTGRSSRSSGPLIGIDEVGRRAGTIGYEVLTSLGRRYQRVVA